jgi:hypothetical protein
VKTEMAETNQQQSLGSTAKKSEVQRIKNLYGLNLNLNLLKQHQQISN